MGALAADDISVDPFPINSRDPAGLRRILGSLAIQKYDVIFFSPFSHSRISEIEYFSNPARAFSPNSELERVASSIIDQTQALLDCLASKFECPIFVHNGSFLQRTLEQAQINNRGYRKLKSDFLRAQPNKWMACRLCGTD